MKKVILSTALSVLVTPTMLHASVIIPTPGSTLTINSVISDYYEVDYDAGASAAGTNVIFDTGAEVTGLRTSGGLPDGISYLASGVSTTTVNAGTFAGSFALGGNSTAVIHSGTFAGVDADDNAIVAFGNAIITINDAFGSNSGDLLAMGGAMITVNGGSFGDDLLAQGGGQIIFNDGTIADDAEAFDSGSLIKIFDGSFSGQIEASEGMIEVRGGTFLNDFRTEAGGIINVIGSGFTIDGLAVGAGNVVPTSGLLEGTLENGDALSVNFDQDYDLTSETGAGVISLTVVPEPSSVLLVLLGSTMALLRRRK